MPPPSIVGFDFVGSLGSGGFGEVYAYDQRVPARRVAVKFLRTTAPGHDAAELVAEANLLGRLDHPHIVPIFQAGLADDGRPYLVMPLYPHAATHRPLGDDFWPADAVVRHGVELAGALETAHRRGVLHRDIKPSNVLVNAYGVVALGDFGLAGGASDDERGLSIPWTAPEVLSGSTPASASSDIYSLAATLWTLLAGHSPFESASELIDRPQLIARIRRQDIPPTGRPDVPAALEAVLARALAKDARRRPASSLAFAEELCDVQRQRGWAVTAPVVGASYSDDSRTDEPVRRASELLTSQPDALSRLPAVPGGRDRPRTRRLVLALAALVVLILTTVVALLLRPNDRPTVTGQRLGDRVTFTWTAPTRPGDTFAVKIADRVVARNVPTLTVDAPGRVCITVQTVDAAGALRGEPSEEACIT